MRRYDKYEIWDITTECRAEPSSTKYIYVYEYSANRDLVNSFMLKIFTFAIDFDLRRERGEERDMYHTIYYQHPLIYILLGEECYTLL